MKVELLMDALDQENRELRERNASLEEQLRQRAFELEVLHDLSGKIGHALDYDELFGIMLTRLTLAIPCSVAAGLLVTEGAGTVHINRLRPLASEVQDQLIERLESSLSRLCGRNVESSAANVRLVQGSDFNPSGPVVGAIRSYFHVPLLQNGSALGMLFVGSDVDECFNEDHVRLLYTVAHQATQSIQRLRTLLRAEQRRLETVVECMPEAVLLFNAKRKLEFANPLGARYLGLLVDEGSREQPLHIGGIPIEDLLCDQGGRCERREVQIDGPPRRTLELVVRDLDRGPEGGGWVLAVHDITQTKDAIGSRDRFLATLAHELRNPLAAILNSVHVVKVGGDSDGILEQAYGVVERQARHMARLIDDLLDLSRVLHGKINLHARSLDLKQVITATLEQNASLFANRRPITVSLPEEPIWINGDATRLEQIVVNLLNNAVKFTGPADDIAIRLNREGADAVVRVVDRGVGIEPELIRGVFDPFMQNDHTLARSQGGLGIGLTLVRSLVEMHGGTVIALSDGIGKGTEFQFRIPVVAPHEVQQPEAPKRGSSVRRRIVLVEDHSDSRAMLSELLRLQGHEVIVAEDGLAGLHAIRRHRPEYAVIDIGLPAIDGYQLAERVRKELPDEKIVLLALTGYGQQEDRDRAVSAGFDAHLVKPVDTAELDRLLNDGAGDGADGKSKR